ncbi:205 kDa microtubule-associated protein [Drosophila serrata]|uniref:205 kDa microtubule-associated protein n=1 Tax=Drosophila serrata TaxID=7274 RepID=UPI000A1D2820|nr:205 kDa microtubule-associated protein [Drosophila serrata]
MEQHEDNYLQNRLAESLQISGGAGENHLLHNLADPAGGDLSAAPKSERDGDGDEDEEWKYIHEVQQTEKLQQQEQHPSDTGNGFGQDDLIHGNGLGNGLAAAAAAAGLSLVYEEEDVEVIKQDGDLSTNSNTTTSTGEVLQQQEEEEEQQKQQQQIELEPEQQQQLQQEDEDEPSSVATTYGTSSLSENNQEEPEQELAPQPAAGAQELLLEAFDNKENAEPAESHEESHSQLNPNAVAFVPSFGSQPSSPLPNNAGVEPMLGLNSRQLLAPMDDLVAESPRKGSARENMDLISVPDEVEFDIEADKRPHELEQESDIFGARDLEQQLLNGAGNGEPVDTLDHGPETSVDLDLSLDQLPADEDVMKQSIYAEHNASIEDILNSVQPLPEQIGDEKELLHVEEKEHVSQSPSTEELQFQQEFQQVRHQPHFFGGAGEDPMQASFYLEHTSLEAQKEHEQEPEEPLQQPSDTSDPFAEQSLLLDTSAPVFSPEAHEPVAKLELESQQADIVDITPSPISSTEEKHLVEDTKELVEEEKIETELVKEQDLELECRLEPAQERHLEQDTHLVEPVSAGAPPQLEEYAAFNAAPGYEAQHDADTAPVLEQGINPFAQPFTPAVNLDLEEPIAAHLEPETQATGNGFNELQLQEELVEEEQYTAKPDFESKYFDLGDKLQEQPTEVQLQEQPTLNDDFVVPQEQQFSAAPEEQVLPPIGDFVAQDQQFIAPEEQLLPVAKEFVEQTTAAAAVVAAAAVAEEPVLSQTEEAVLPTTEPVVDDLPESEKYEEQAVPVAEVAAVAAAAAAVTVAAVAATTKSKDRKPSPQETKKPAAKTAPAASKPKPAGTTASTAIKKTTTSSTTTAKTTTARPRTAPVATTKPATSAPPTAATRKPLSSSSAGTSAKPSAPRTALSSTTTRPATAPVSKPTAAASKTTASKPTTSAARTSTAPRPAASTTARKPATNGTGTGTATGTAARKPVTSASSTTRSTLSSSAAAPKPRLPAASTTASAAAAKPKVPSPRAAVSTTSAVRKVASTNGTSLTARSPTKPTTNGLGSKATSSTTTTTTTTTITKTFTARPAPKFTHSTATNGSATARRPLGTTTSSSLTSTTASASLRKSSPIKASPLKTATTKPLTPKAKESATAAKPSPAGLKARKSTPLKGSTPTPIKAPVAAAPPAEPAAATNGDTKEEEAIKQNGNGVHDVEEAQEIQEQPPIQDQVNAAAAEVALLDF